MIVSRLVVVSNRVAPITEGQATAGGLAAGVLDALKQQGGIWFGWSGDIVATPSGQPNARQKVGPISLFTIDLSRKDYDEFYRGFANDTLWPVLHYQMGLSRFDWEEFSGYQRVNDQFARALAPILQPDDLVWAHDYHLLCLADSLRQAGCRNRIGLFLHTPFPAPPVFMTVTAHAELIRAMCEYDLVGFQTETDRAGFADYVLRHCAGELLETNAEGQILRAYDRVIRTGVYPIGVHVDEVRGQAKAQANKRHADRLHASLRHGQLILSVTGSITPKACASASRRSSASWRIIRRRAAVSASCRSRHPRAATSRPTRKSAGNSKPRRAASTAASPKLTGCRCAI